MKKPHILTPDEQLEKQQKTAQEFKDWVRTSFTYWETRCKKNPEGSLAEIRLQIDSIAKNIKQKKSLGQTDRYEERIAHLQYIDALTDLKAQLIALVEDFKNVKTNRVKPGNKNFKTLEMPSGFYADADRLKRENPKQSQNWIFHKLAQLHFNGDTGKISTIRRKLNKYWGK